LTYFKSKGSEQRGLTRYLAVLIGLFRETRFVPVSETDLILPAVPSIGHKKGPMRTAPNASAVLSFLLWLTGLLPLFLIRS
jgi:hypothetical protein